MDSAECGERERVEREREESEEWRVRERERERGVKTGNLLGVILNVEVQTLKK